MTSPAAVRTSGEHREPEAALRESETRFRALSAASPVGIFQSDDEGRITYANTRVLQIFALTEEEGLGHGWIKRVHPDDVEALVTGWHAALRAQRDFAHEYRVLPPDGTIRWVLGRAAPLHAADGVAPGTVGTVEDITVRKELEAQLLQAQKMEAVGQLAGGVAHDFNNLLAVIKANAELALETLACGEPLYDELVEITRAAERAAALTRQLLAFSRKQVLQPRLLDLNEVIAGVAPMLKRLIGEDIGITTQLAPDLGAVRADPGQLEQVLLNLAVNARDAMPRGGSITLRALNFDVSEGDGASPEQVAPGRYVLLTVRDTGCGMTREVRARIFEPFFTTKGLGQGTGLGLSTVYGIVEQSGGRVWVDSEVGCGTTFTLCLPRVTESETPESSRRPDPAAGGAETVLIVDDEHGMRRLARRILERQGYAVLEASDGRHALEVAAAHGGPLHVLLTDVVMPELNGRALAEQLSAHHPSLRVIYMSGYTDDESIRRGLESNTGFVEKPFTADTLARAIRTAIDGRVSG